MIEVYPSSRLLLVISLVCLVLSVASMIAGNYDELEIMLVRMEVRSELSPFNQQVMDWSYELKDMESPYEGNCVPVAQELQKRIVATGRMAVIIVTDPEPGDDIYHAMVMYDSDKSGTFDRVIDNGYSTGNAPWPRDSLYDGAFGKYLGICKEPEGNKCLVSTPI